MLLVALWAALGWLVAGALAPLGAALPVGGAGRVLAGRCSGCAERLGWRRLTLLGGRRGESCPGCGASLRAPWPLVEVLGAAAFAALAWRFGWRPALALYSALAALLALVVLADVRHRLIPDLLVLPAIALALPLTLAMYGPAYGLLGGLVAGGLFGLLYLLARLAYPGEVALGLGDVKLALLLGLLAGGWAALSLVLLSVAAGAILALGLLLAGRPRSYAMPYGPSLALGMLATLLLDPRVWR